MKRLLETTVTEMSDGQSAKSLSLVEKKILSVLVSIQAILATYYSQLRPKNHLSNRVDSKTYEQEVFSAFFPHNKPNNKSLFCETIPYTKSDLANTFAPFEELLEDIIACIISELPPADSYNLFRTSKFLWSTQHKYNTYIHQMLCRAFFNICETKIDVNLEQYLETQREIAKLRAAITCGPLIPNLTTIDRTYAEPTIPEALERIVLSGYWRLLEESLNHPSYFIAELIKELSKKDNLFFRATVNGYPQITMLLKRELPWNTTQDVTDECKLKMLSPIHSDPLHNLVLFNPIGFKKIWSNPNFQPDISINLPPAVTALLQKMDLNIAYTQHYTRKATKAQVTKFIKQADNLGWNCLHWAVALHELDFFKHVVENYNINIDCETVININGIQRYHSTNFRPITIACLMNHREFIQYLIDNGCTLEPVSRDHPLHILAACGHVDSLQLLLNRADLDINTLNEMGATALHLACQHDQSECVKILLEHGIDYTLEQQDMLRNGRMTALQLTKPGSDSFKLLSHQIENQNNQSLTLGSKHL